MRIIDKARLGAGLVQNNWRRGIRLCALCAGVAGLGLFFAACTSQPQVQFDSLETLVAEGVIAVFSPDEIQSPEFTFTQVTRGDIFHQQAFPITIVFPYTYHLHFAVETLHGDDSVLTSLAWDYAYFNGVNFRLEEQVNAGDFIAELTFEVPEAIVIAAQSLELERRQFEANFTAEQTRRRQDIRNMQAARDEAAGDERELLNLRIRQAELSYTQFMTNTENSRQSFDDRLAQINGPVQPERLYAPVSGRISWMTQNATPRFLRDIVPVRFAGRRIVSIRDNEHMQFIANAPLQALRFGDIIEVGHAAGDAYFYATVVTDPLTQNMLREGSHDVHIAPLEGEWERFLEVVGDDLSEGFDMDTLLDFIALRARSTLPRLIDGVIVERDAITEEAGRQFVTLFEDGSFSRRYVVTGVNGHIEVPREDGEGYQRVQVVQIISGLSPGQWVTIP